MSFIVGDKVILVKELPLLGIGTITSISSEYIPSPWPFKVHIWEACQVLADEFGLFDANELRLATIDDEQNYLMLLLARTGYD